MFKILIPVLIFLLSSSLNIFAQTDYFDLDENNLFNEDQLVETVSNEADSRPVFNQEKGVQFSGVFYSNGSYSIAKDYILAKANSWSKNVFSSYSYGDLFIDARLDKGYKAFMDIGFAVSSQLPTQNTLSFNSVFKELFMDMNWDRLVYIRAGKQVLQWGRTYLWNPTDLVNIQKKSFLNMDLARSGTYGIKTHIPLGTYSNIYFFTDLNEVDNLDKIALASKYEWTWQGSEMSLSSWLKYNQPTAIGYDISTSIWGLTISSELAMLYGGDYQKVSAAGLKSAYSDKYEPQVSISIGRNFDLELSDRINFIFEYFYNGLGYDDNVLANSTQKTVLLNDNLYHPYYLSKWYTAIFLTINKFPWLNTSFSLNSILNGVDQSGLVSMTISYSPVYNFDFNLTLNQYFGTDSTEFGSVMGAIIKDSNYYTNSTEIQIATSIMF